jgi:hypothetical protein
MQQTIPEAHTEYYGDITREVGMHRFFQYRVGPLSDIFIPLARLTGVVIAISSSRQQR